MRVLILVILQLFLFLSVHAQEKSSLIFRIGMGNYSMKSQKLFQNDFSKRLGIPFRKVHEFPNFPTFGGAMGFTISDAASMGLWGEFASTGGRLHYSDYSGHAMLDQVLTSFQIGPYFQVRLNKSDAWPFYFTAHGSVSTTTENIKSEFKVWSQSELERIKLKATNFGLRPGLMLGHSVGVLNFQLGFGGEIQSARKLADNKENVIMTSDRKELSAQWSGWRTTLGVGFVF
jgi:hypothetical protein